VRLHLNDPQMGAYSIQAEGMRHSEVNLNDTCTRAERNRCVTLAGDFLLQATEAPISRPDLLPHMICSLQGGWPGAVAESTEAHLAFGLWPLACSSTCAPMVLPRETLTNHEWLQGTGAQVLCSLVLPAEREGLGGRAPSVRVNTWLRSQCCRESFGFCGLGPSLGNGEHWGDAGCHARLGWEHGFP